ncbi:acyl-CoA thioesterase/BAAT N-terminal domain-containing protein [Leifsonia sp. NPDC058292]|uniref:acyl-CoA thioesterase/bile acid-CoA:amino acid N-acyltransferase family protein n=1 Tax=Leifsonia sp. NPDC058292 TaxID=3346428 RepID=UPI0036DE0702
MRVRRTFRRAAIAAVCWAGALALTITGCTAPPTASGSGPRFVTPPLIHYTSVLWPVPLELVGAEPGSRLRLAATMSARQGHWSSEATYTVPLSGSLDLARAKPQLAAFDQPDSAGLFWSLKGPDLTTFDQIGLWMRSTVDVRVDAFDGARVVATKTFRLDGLGLGSRPSRVTGRDLQRAAAAAAAGSTLERPAPLPPGSPESGPVGDFYSARSIERPRTPAVLVFDDTSPGASSDYIAPLLTQFGTAVLVLPSGGAATGAETVRAINAATVAASLDWLDARDDINARSIFVYGTGSAEQFALWAATRFSNRIAGAFAAGGSTALLCLPGSDVSAVFEDGIGVPCQGDAGRVNPAAVFPLDTVSGQIVLACAERDEQLLNACRWLDAAEQARGPHAGDRMLRVAGAAHPITVPPGLPIDLGDPATAEATEHGRVAFWNAVGAILLRATRT